MKTDIGPYTLVPEWVLRSGISSGALGLYCELGLRADRESGESWPSRKTLAAALGVSDRTVDARTKELIKAGALQVVSRTSESGDLTSNLYIVMFSSPGSEGIFATGYEGIFAYNQNQSEPEVPKNPAVRVSVNPVQPTPDQLYLARKAEAGADNPSLTPAVLVMLNKRYGVAEVCEVLRSTADFGGPVDDWVAYLTAILNARKEAMA